METMPFEQLYGVQEKFSGFMEAIALTLRKSFPDLTYSTSYSGYDADEGMPFINSTFYMITSQMMEAVGITVCEDCGELHHDDEDMCDESLVVDLTIGTINDEPPYFRLMILRPDRDEPIFLFQKDNLSGSRDEVDDLMDFVFKKILENQRHIKAALKRLSK